MVLCAALRRWAAGVERDFWTVGDLVEAYDEDEKRHKRQCCFWNFRKQSSEQHLAHLQEKAKRISRNVLAVSKWMEDRSKGYNTAGSGEEDRVYVTEAGGYVNILAKPRGYKGDGS